MRKAPIDLLCGVSLCAALVAAASGAPAEGLFLLATFAALLVLRRFALPPGFEFAFAAGVLLQGWGNALLLFERVDWYDKAVHFLTPMLIVPSLCLLMVRSGALAPPWGGSLRRGVLGVFVVAVAIGTALAAIWELVEASTDRWLGTNLAHGYTETIADLYASALGSLAGGSLLVWLAARERDPDIELLGGEALAESE